MPQAPGDRPSEGDPKPVLGIGVPEGLCCFSGFLCNGAVELALKLGLYGRFAKAPATVSQRLLEPLHTILNWLGISIHSAQPAEYRSCAPLSPHGNAS